MVHEPKVAANELIRRGIEEGKPLTHIEVQKLLYFSHGWMLGIHGRPLHHGIWEAWRYGPVLPEIYFNLNHYRGRRITALIPAWEDEFDADELLVMGIVYDYRALGPFTLVGIAHSRGGPWDRVWHDQGDSGIISNEMIRDYFAGLLKRDGAGNV